VLITTPLNSDESLSDAYHKIRDYSELSGRNGQMKSLDHYTPQQFVRYAVRIEREHPSFRQARGPTFRWPRCLVPRT
jgi:hypothetical protein